MKCCLQYLQNCTVQFFECRYLKEGHTCCYLLRCQVCWDEVAVNLIPCCPILCTKARVILLDIYNICIKYNEVYQKVYQKTVLLSGQSFTAAYAAGAGWLRRLCIAPIGSDCRTADAQESCSCQQRDKMYCINCLFAYKTPYKIISSFYKIEKKISVDLLTKFSCLQTKICNSSVCWHYVALQLQKDKQVDAPITCNSGRNTWYQMYQEVIPNICAVHVCCK